MNLPLITSALSGAALVFLAGVAVGAYELFPYKHIKAALNNVETVLADKDRIVSNRPTGFLAKARYDGENTTIYLEDKMDSGLTLLSGFFGDLPGLRLVRHDGTVVNEWPASYSSLFPDATYIEPESSRPATDWNAAVHGMHLNPDGSVVFNFDGKGTVKLDRCGKPVWTLERMTHHSIDEAADGSFWIPSRYYVQGQPEYPLFKTPYLDDTILRVSADGEPLEEVSVNQILIDSGLFSLLVANGRFEVAMQVKDPMHVNDIDELRAEDAAAFPHLAAGDLLLSMRHLNLLVIVDPDTWTVKWHRAGRWLRQHDPDFNPDGTISLVNNNSDDTKNGEILGGSEIVSIVPYAPQEGEDVVFGPAQDENFFSNTQAKHQRLDNGNTVVAEYYGGRAFEYDQNGMIVWQYINRYDEDTVAKVSGAMRYPMEYFTVDDWSCAD